MIAQVAGFRVTQAALCGIPNADRVNRWPAETVVAVSSQPW